MRQFYINTDLTMK